jgi:hypothetical protein
MAGSPAPGCPIASQAWRLEARAKFVMPGLVPGIHVPLLLRKKDVDGRDEPGHDEKSESYCFFGHTLSVRSWNPHGESVRMFCSRREDFAFDGWRTAPARFFG